MKPQAIQRGHGFTIVELLVVIIVVGILATLTIVIYTTVQERAATKEAEGDLRQAAMKVEAYRSNNGAYPATQDVVDDGKGLPKTDAARTYTYKQMAGDQYCLSTYVQRTKKTLKIASPNNSLDGYGSIVEGVCSS